MSYLANITSEERKELRVKGQEKIQEKQQWATDNLKLDWSDDSYWRDLAKKHGVRLPRWYEPAKSKFVNRFLKEKGLGKEWYQDHTGYLNGNIEAKENPKMPAFVQVGLLLEAYDEEFNIQEI